MVKMYFIIGISFTVALVNANNKLSAPSKCPESDDCGIALFLTPYINGNRLSEAREASKVASFLPKEPQITSHSGYLTVNEDTDANLFFWLFPSLKDPKNAPIVLWLGGTPGIASSSRAFFNNGPYTVSRRCECLPFSLHTTVYHWLDIMHVLYIDSPVGVGFSFAKNASGLSNTTDDVVKDLYSAICQIFRIFPEYQTREFFIVGESYSAKYVPALASLISLKNPDARVKLNLKGVAIGNGWLDPATMLGYSNVLYGIGLIDSDTKDYFEELENDISSLIGNGSFSEAFDSLQNYMPFIPTDTPSLVENVTGFSYFGNYLQYSNNDKSKYLVDVMEFLNQPEIRRQLHVGTEPFTMFNEDVFERLKFDLFKSVAPEFTTAMDNYRVLLYNGQLDISCAYHLTSKILQNINWKGSERYMKAQRRKWHFKGEVAGYVKTSGNFTEVLVRDAGLSMAEDQPLWYWDLIKKFTQNIPFF